MGRKLTYLGLGILITFCVYGQVGKMKTVENFILDLPDAYLVYQPAGDTLQIAAQNNVLSYGSDWERRQVKPYLFHLKHRSWRNFFWKVNTSRREVYLVWGGVFGSIGAQSGSQNYQEVSGEKTELILEVSESAATRPPERFFIRFGRAELFFNPAAGDLRLAAAGTTLSPCNDWESCTLKPFLYEIRLKTWKDFFWKVNTSKKQVWRCSGVPFCQMGGSETLLAIAMRSFRTAFSISRLRTSFSAAESQRLQAIARLVVEGKPLADIIRVSNDFIKQSPGLDSVSAVQSLSDKIKSLENQMETVKNKRQEAMTSFENIDQKANQLFNLLSTVLKNMKDTQSGIIRNLTD